VLLINVNVTAGWALLMPDRANRAAKMSNSFFILFIDFTYLTLTMDSAGLVWRFFIQLIISF